MRFLADLASAVHVLTFGFGELSLPKTPYRLKRIELAGPGL